MLANACRRDSVNTTESLSGLHCLAIINLPSIHSSSKLLLCRSLDSPGLKNKFSNVNIITHNFTSLLYVCGAGVGDQCLSFLYVGWESRVYHNCMCVETGWSIKVMGVIVAFWGLVLHLTT